MEEILQFWFAALVMVQQLDISHLKLKYTKNLFSTQAENAMTTILQNFIGKMIKVSKVWSMYDFFFFLSI